MNKSTPLAPPIRSFAEWCFRALREEVDLWERDPAGGYRSLHRIFNQLLPEATRGSGLAFGSNFARLEYLVKSLGYSSSRRAELNGLRHRARRADQLEERELRDWFLFDARSLSHFIADLYGVTPPSELAKSLKEATKPHSAPRELLSSMRVMVESWDDEYIYCHDSSGAMETLRARYRYANQMGDWCYFGALLKEGSQINLVRPREREGALEAELLVLEPDLLVNITQICDSLRPGSNSWAWPLMRQFKPSTMSNAMLLGIFAGKLLDRVLQTSPEEPISYSDAVREFFHEQPLTITASQQALADGEFHSRAKSQLMNLRYQIDALLPRVPNYNASSVLLEPSFFCELLGLQGRSDLLQADYRLLLEQKSGKWDEYAARSLGREGQGVHREEHYAQMILYLAVLHYGFGMRHDEVTTILLYSRYSEGLIFESPAPRLLGRCMRFRNGWVSRELMLARGEGTKLLGELNAGSFCPANTESKLWQEYQLPEIESFLAPLWQEDALALRYFYRMVEFVSLESYYARTGGGDRPERSFSALWQTSLAEKLEAGTIFPNLSLRECTALHHELAGFDMLHFAIAPEQADYISNFRRGDIVILYRYIQGQEPDCRRGLVHRGNLVEINDGEVIVRLRAPQHNQRYFSPEGGLLWAMEHDYYDSSNAQALQGLYAFLEAPKGRRDLLLGRQTARFSHQLELRGDYTLEGGDGEFNEVALRARKAMDYFLLIGPPGTGKTSFGLMSIVREELLDPSGSVLLASFTNRAVDEICDKLERAQLDYIRVGSRLGCADAYSHRLLREQSRGCKNHLELRDLIARTPIFVGTTASLTGARELFSFRDFSLMVVDEAAQILEPQLLPLLSVRSAIDSNRSAIGRFVLIGDHCQLPSVVVQPPSASEVTDKSLRAMGLHNCRESLFERLLRLAGPDSPAVYRLSRQGRMHPAVADFPNRFFYDSQLVPVPLAHQREGLCYKRCGDEFMKQLATNRLLFYSVSPAEAERENPKSNRAEAELIARIIVSLIALYALNERPFDAGKSLGVIVPFRNQIATIRHALKEQLIDFDTRKIAIDTVERFQGAEYDTIIYGFTVREYYQLETLTADRLLLNDFLLDRRLNVALTRARKQVILVGHGPLLKEDPLFRQLIEAYGEMPISG